VFDDETRSFLESGCGLIVGTVAADGAPHAARGWGLEVLEAGPPARCRLLLDSDDERSIAHVVEGGAISVTATDVMTLRSIQLKGRAIGPEVLTPEDVARGTRYVEAFFTDVHAVDDVPWELFERFMPHGYVVCAFEAHERYDQTPGPGAGARVEVGG
jgi:hypothetical protein